MSHHHPHPHMGTGTVLSPPNLQDTQPDPGPAPHPRKCPYRLSWHLKKDCHQSSITSSWERLTPVSGTALQPGNQRGRCERPSSAGHPKGHVIHPPASRQDCRGSEVSDPMRQGHTSGMAFSDSQEVPRLRPLDPGFERATSWGLAPGPRN